VGLCCVATPGAKVVAELSSIAWAAKRRVSKLDSLPRTGDRGYGVHLGCREICINSEHLFDRSPERYTAYPVAFHVRGLFVKYLIALCYALIALYTFGRSSDRPLTRSTVRAFVRTDKTVSVDPMPGLCLPETYLLTYSS
jgi:hypothetical protein